MINIGNFKICRSQISDRKWKVTATVTIEIADKEARRILELGESEVPREIEKALMEHYLGKIEDD